MNRDVELYVVNVSLKARLGVLDVLISNILFGVKICPVKSCVETKELNHCGECEDFPCKLAKSYAYDEKQGDQGKRLEQCRCWGKIK